MGAAQSSEAAVAKAQEPAQAGDAGYLPPLGPPNPSNPVVCYDGQLRSDLFSRLKREADTADLVLVIGTR